MAQNKFALVRYHLIDFLLHKFDYVKTVSIVEYCIEKTGFNITSRTIQLDIYAMKNDEFLGYYAPIEYCKQRKAYYYKDLDYQLLPLQESPDDVIRLEEILIQYKELIMEDHYTEIMHIIFKIKLTQSKKN